jgi:hypothetical protein
MFKFQFSRKLGWVLIFPYSIFIYFSCHILATIFFQVTNYIHPNLAYGQGFINSVLAPGISAYFSILLPIEFFKKTRTDSRDLASIKHNNYDNNHDSLPRKILILFWILIYGVLAGFGVFTSNWSAVLSTIVGLLVVAYAFSE